MSVIDYMAFHAAQLGDLPRSTDKPVKQRDEPGWCPTCGRQLSRFNLGAGVKCGPCDRATRQGPTRSW